MDEVNLNDFPFNVQRVIPGYSFELITEDDIHQNRRHLRRRPKPHRAVTRSYSRSLLLIPVPKWRRLHISRLERFPLQLHRPGLLRTTM